MNSLSTFFCALLSVACVGMSLAEPVAPPRSPAPTPRKIDFNRDIRPILSDNCFACHGPDEKKRQADLRLDEPNRAVVAGDILASELIRRVNRPVGDPRRMPPADFHKTLTAEQKRHLMRWIDEGAVYKKHWAYEPPVKSAVPAGINPVDFLVRKRLAEVGLKPSPSADRRTLIRRLSFDLIGLPPTPAEVAAFTADRSPNAYGKLVERLLASPHYGERMALGWLDIVRYADTIGYHSDNPRNVWPYRDYVIASFNANKPFDRFTREQLAGDLLPDASRETRIGSAFNRLLLTTEEGGAQPKDYEARYLTDRVRAVGTVWLGQTTGCAQCHDHKFDPIRMRDFYALGAYFADIEEAIVGAREPGLLLADDDQLKELARREARVSELRKRVDGPHPELADAQAAWEKSVVTAPGKTPGEIVEIAKIAPETRTPDQSAKLTAHFTSVAPELAELRRERDEAQKARDEYDRSLPRCLVTNRNPQPRTVRVLPRGNFLDESGETVQPATPAFLPAATGGTRLDLANWLVNRRNPLTARTVMNRLWKQFFGTPLSKVPEDLGAQGEPPTNPELLDWLACEFMDRGWDIKHMVRLLVNSATYRQVSTASKTLLARDPDNREYARQSRFRPEAEIVRDNALFVAGLLSPKIGGPSVKPYQPDRYWENLNFPVREYVPDTGESQYRRGLYVWWQRSFLHPSLLAFDAPSREECTAERTRSNIPQQALVLLNDPTYVEAARVFGARLANEATGTPGQRIVWGWRQALQRTPDALEARTLLGVYERRKAQYAADPNAADALLKTGLAPVPATAAKADLAAWTHVARVLLNLHETITRP
ncbi:MAG: PSD1 and planctomycete cytochrome C domain-containing protein [Capsulimonadales bacterium]|nr:PSD1 and planctomycete cytochrome C domain-containing protein [Capsulimonadales bacterium]